MAAVTPRPRKDRFAATSKPHFGHCQRLWSSCIPLRRQQYGQTSSALDCVRYSPNYLPPRQTRRRHHRVRCSRSLPAIVELMFTSMMFSFAWLNNIVTVSTKMFEDLQRISKQQQATQQQLLIVQNILTTWSGIKFCKK